MAGRKPRSTPKPPASTFADAIKFASLILKDHGAVNETHVHIKDHWLTAFNGVLAIGHKCDSDIVAAPQCKLTREALSKCGQTIATAQLTNRLLIESGQFRALVPCIDIELIEPPKPDPPIAIIDDRLKEALAKAGELGNENGQMVYNVSVLLHAGSVISSMGSSLLYEHWHGIDLPPLCVVPIALSSVLRKMDRRLARFGYSERSITLYFEDESWIRTQLYPDQWPEVAHIFDCQADLAPIPADFWTALAAVSPFSEGLIYLRSGTLASHAQEGAGAEFNLPMMQGSWCYPAKHLAFLQSWATHWDTQAQPGPVLLAMGKNARAIVAGVRT